MTRLNRARRNCAFGPSRWAIGPKPLATRQKGDKLVECVEETTRGRGRYERVTNWINGR